MRRSTALALVAGSVIAAARPAAAQTDLPVVRIGTNPIDSLGEPYYGSERGIFRDNGINAQVTTLANGSTTLQAVVSGDLDVGLANIVQVAAGVAHNIPLQMIAPAALYSAKHGIDGRRIGIRRARRTPPDGRRGLIRRVIGNAPHDDRQRCQLQRQAHAAHDRDEGPVVPYLLRFAHGLDDHGVSRCRGVARPR